MNPPLWRWLSGLTSRRTPRTRSRPPEFEITEQPRRPPRAVRRRALPAPEFAITEQPHETPASAAVPGQNPWQLAVQEAERLVQSAAEAQGKLRKLGETHDTAKRKFLVELIENVMDNFDRVLERTDGGSTDPVARNWLKRFALTRRSLEQLLATEQVVPIEFAGAPDGLVFTREVVPRDDVPEGTIVEVDCRGWLWRGEVLRKASVVRSDNSGTTAGALANDRKEHMNE